MSDHPMAQKPPLGVMPRWRWLELRAEALHSAIARRKGTVFEIPQQWLDELIEIEGELQEWKKTTTSRPTRST